MIEYFNRFNLNKAVNQKFKIRVGVPFQTVTLRTKESLILLNTSKSKTSIR